MQWLGIGTPWNKLSRPGDKDPRERTRTSLSRVVPVVVQWLGIRTPWNGKGRLRPLKAWGLGPKERTSLVDNVVVIVDDCVLSLPST